MVYDFASRYRRKTVNEHLKARRVESLNDNLCRGRGFKHGTETIPGLVVFL